MDATVFLFAVYDEVSQTVQVVRQIDRGEEHGGGSFPLGKGFTSEVIRTGTPRIVRWAAEGPPIRLLYGTEPGELVSPRSGVVVPIVSGGRVVGVLSAQSYRPEAYENEDLLSLCAIAAHADGSGLLDASAAMNTAAPPAPGGALPGAIPGGTVTGATSLAAEELPRANRGLRPRRWIRPLAAAGPLRNTPGLEGSNARRHPVANAHLGQRRLGQRCLGQLRLGQCRLGQRGLGQRGLGQRCLGQRCVG